MMPDVLLIFANSSMQTFQVNLPYDWEGGNLFCKIVKVFFQKLLNSTFLYSCLENGNDYIDTILIGYHKRGRKLCINLRESLKNLS